MRFKDRLEAGRQLAAALKSRRYQRPVVLGIPRGGVPVAAEVARALDAEIGVIVARKLGAPGNPELAIGATTATGASYINHSIASMVGAGERYIALEKDRQVLEAKRREELFDGHRRPSLKGRIVIVVDDGIATGATAIAAVRSVKAEGAERVILAVPVGSPETIRFMEKEADEVICLSAEPDFWGVGQFYDDFSPVEDWEVKGTLDAFTAAPVADPQRVELQRGEVRLIGVLTTPPGDGPFPLVIFVHGLGSSKDSPRNATIACSLVDAGIATLLFDLSGHGESSPDHASIGFSGGGVAAYVVDVEAMFEWATSQENLDKDLIGIAGSSLGAVVAARAAGGGRIKPKALLLRAPPMEADDFEALSVPSLVVIGSRDPLRPDVMAGTRGCPQLTVSVVEGAGHLFDEPGTLEEALRLTVEWFSNQLRASTPSSV